MGGPTSSHEPPRLSLPVNVNRDHWRGPLRAPVTLLAYGGYECPHSAAAHPQVLRVLKRLGRGLRFVFRHFPLSTAHPHALHAAMAAEAAGAQGQYWAMHDYLFEHQGELDDGSLVMHAATLGLDVHHFETDLAEERHAERVREDVISGAQSGVIATPAFFLDGVRHHGALDAVTLLGAIRALRRGRASGP